MEHEPAVFEVAVVDCSFEFAVARAEVGTSLAPSCVPWVVCCTSTVWIHAQSRVVFLEFTVMLSSVFRFKLSLEQSSVPLSLLSHEPSSVPSPAPSSVPSSLPLHEPRSVPCSVPSSVPSSCTSPGLIQAQYRVIEFAVARAKVGTQHRAAQSESSSEPRSVP